MLYLFWCLLHKSRRLLLLRSFVTVISKAEQRWQLDSAESERASKPPWDCHFYAEKIFVRINRHGKRWTLSFLLQFNQGMYTDFKAFPIPSNASRRWSIFHKLQTRVSEQTVFILFILMFAILYSPSKSLSLLLSSCKLTYPLPSLIDVSSYSLDWSGLHIGHIG